MNTPASRRRYRLAFLMAFSTVAAMGCGGGGGGAPTPPPPAAPTPVSITGTVIGGAGATVCLDVNADGTCNAGEAATTAAANGSYTLTATAGISLDGLAVVAQVPAGVGGAAHVLKAPASKAAVVSPITSVVQAGVQQGLTLPASESATALQLQVAAANLYADYLGGTPTADTASLTAIGAATVEGLRLGMPLVVAPAANTTPDYTVYLFTYGNAQNYNLRRDYQTSTAPDPATGLHAFYALAGGRLAGNPRPIVPTETWASTPGGWAPYFNQGSAHLRTTGNPSISVRGNGFREVITHVDVDVAGQSIADVVRQVQDQNLNTQITITLNPATLAGVMPAGAKIRRMRVTTLATPLFHSTDQDATTSTGASTLASLVAAHPTPAVPTQETTVWLGAAQLPLACTPTAGGVCPAEALRASFGPGNTANYYFCDWDLFSNESANCIAAGSGTYTIGTAADNTTPVMSFSDLPASTRANLAERVLVQRSDGIFVGMREHLGGPRTETRLDRVAFEALAATLALPAPAVGAVSPFFGLWRAPYDGPESGSCSPLLVDPLGVVSAQCNSASGGRSYRVNGTVDNTGSASFSSFLDDHFTGIFSPTAANGTWTQAGTPGTWSATRY